MNAVTEQNKPGAYSLHDQGEDAVLTRYSLQRDGNVALLFEPHVGLTARDVERVFSAHDDMLAALYSAEIKLARYMSIHGPNSAEPLRGTYSGGLSAEYEASLKTIRAAIAKAEAR